MGVYYGLYLEQEQGQCSCVSLIVQEWAEGNLCATDFLLWKDFLRAFSVHTEQTATSLQGLPAKSPAVTAEHGVHLPSKEDGLEQYQWYSDLHFHRGTIP